MAADLQPIDHPPASRSTTPWPMIAAAWIVVGVPAVWGVSQTVRTATALFRPAAAGPASVPTPAVPAPTSPSAASQQAAPR